MKKSIFFIGVFLAIALALAPALEAKIHYINKGVKYHIGDNRFVLSEDSEFLDAYPVVGQEWIQAFQVSVADKVKVHIDKIWGVDDCEYCKVIISIDDRDMLRLSYTSNHKAANTLEPLAAVLQPGVTHLLKIASYGAEKVDDFMIEDVSVESQVADIKLLDPGPILKAPLDPLPVFEAPAPMPTPPPPSSPCESAVPKTGWFPGESQGKTSFELANQGRAGAGSGKLCTLSPGEAVEFYVMLDALTGKQGPVEHSLELTLEGVSKDGWVLSFSERNGSFLHGNLMQAGGYRHESFRAPGFRAGVWNQLRLQSCVDGQVRMLVNGQEVSRSLTAVPGSNALNFRAVGLRARFSRTAAAAPEQQSQPELPPPGVPW